MSSDGLNQPTHSSVLTGVIPSLPRATQTSSLLLRLPSELRLMVLRYILVRDTPISKRENYKHPFPISNKGSNRDSRGRFLKQTRKKRVHGYNLPSSVFRTCQILLPEGLAVLYRENTLALDISIVENRGIGGATTVETLNGQTLLDRIGDGTWNRDQNLLKVATQFTNFSMSLNLQVRDLGQLRCLIYHTAAMFVKSKVEVPTRWLSFPGEQLSADNQVRLSKQFLLLRCSKFRFTDLAAPETLVVVEIISSDQMVLNLEDFSSTLTLMQDTMKCVWRSNYSFSRYVHQLDVVDFRLVQATEDFDVPAYLQARLEFLQMYQELGRRTQSMDLVRRLARNFLMFITPGVRKSQILGLETKDYFREGLNARLRELAVRHNFVPINNDDAATT